MARAIGTLGTIDSLTIAGRVLTDLTNLITLHAGIQNATGGSFRNANGSAGYQVTAAKTLTLVAGRFYASAAVNCQLLYSDNDLGLAGATAPTNGVWMLTNSSGTFFTIYAISTSGVELNLDFDIPATKYVGYKTASANSTHGVVFGYEV